MKDTSILNNIRYTYRDHDSSSVYSSLHPLRGTEEIVGLQRTLKIDLRDDRLLPPTDPSHTDMPCALFRHMALRE
jgi:hypothetical protein